MDIEKIDYVKFYQEQYKFEGETELKNVQFNCKNTPAFMDYLLSLTDHKPTKAQLEKLFDFYPLLSNIGVSQSARSVCAKIVKRGETIVECIDCRMDQSCIICFDCFKNGQHAGHKILYKKAFGGCCDCGDTQAWKPEGFCTQHSGEVQDIPINQKQVQKFNMIFQDLFYIYYKLKLQRKNKHLNNFVFIILVKAFQTIIQQGPKGIKLIALFLNSKMPKNLMFNVVLQNQTIIKHMFFWKFIKTDFQFWQNIFIKMFPYYEFKKKLLQTYIQCFPMFYSCEQSSNFGQSIACQILTSYKLVEDYADNKNNKPFMFNYQSIPDKQRLVILTKIIYNDLQKIHSLQSNAPIKFIKLQLTQGLDSIFAFHHLFVAQTARNVKAIEKINLKQKAKKKKQIKSAAPGGKGDSISIQDSSQYLFKPILTMVKNINNCEIEFITLTMLRKMLRVIKDQQSLLISLLRHIVSYIENQADVMKDLSIFRSYDRAFSLILFTLCNENLEVFLDPNFQKFLQDGLQKDPSQFAKLINDLQKRMMQTYFFSTHVSCNQNKGYNSTFFNYLYFYRGKDRLLFCIDIVLLKMLALLNNNQQAFQFTKIMRFQDFQEQKWTLHIFNTFYQSYRLLFISKFAQIYLTHYEIEEAKAELYPQTITAIAKFIVGEGNAVTLDKVNKFTKTFLFDNIQLLKKYLLKCCTYSKEKKIFQLLLQFRDLRPYNLQDFESMIQEETLCNRVNEQRDLMNTLELMEGYNKIICEHYLSEQNVQILKQAIVGLNSFGEQETEQTLTSYAKLVCQFAIEVRFIEPEPLISKQLMIRIQIKPEIKKKLQQYKQLIGEETVFQEDLQNKVKEKKELLRLKKLKKLNEIKKKNEDNITAIKEVHNLQHKQSAQNEEFCAICRKIDINRSQLVYICSLTIRNLDKLFGKGDGISTISFTSCYHLFHSECLNKQLKVTVHTTILKCPTCRKAGNIFLPAYPLENQESNKVYIQAFLQKLTHIMMTINCYKQIDPYQELIKSFYLYAQLFMFDWEYMKSRRVRLYRNILQLLSHPCLYQKAYNFFLKFTKNQITLLPILLKKDKLAIAYLLQSTYNGMEIEDIGDIESDEAEEIENQIIMKQKFLSAAVKEPISKKKSSGNSKYKGQMPVQMRFLIIKLLINIFQKHRKYYHNESQEIKQAINDLKDGLVPQVSTIVQYAYLQLTEQSDSNIKIEEAAKTFEFIKLPKYYDWDMSKNICGLCNETCDSVYICLLCDWKGCLDCKKGGVNTHYQSKHGEECAFLLLNNATIFIVQSKILYKIGCIYFNEWGEQFKIKKDWKSFELDESKLQKAKDKLLREE